MAEKITRSRVGPRAVVPVVHDNIRYAAGPRRATGNGYQMGYVEARDSGTNSLLWELQVYEIDYAPDREVDVQEVYITSLRMVDGGLEVVNERGEKYRVDPGARTVRRVSGHGPD